MDTQNKRMKDTKDYPQPGPSSKAVLPARPLNNPLSPEEKVFTNLLILDKILKYLDFPTLNGIRTLGRRWKSTADKILLRRDYPKLKITSVGSFLNRLKRRGDVNAYPCTDFILSHEVNFSPEELKRFTRLVCPKVHTLELVLLNNYNHPLRSMQIENLLEVIKNSKNLRKLVLHFSFSSILKWNDLDFTIPSLKHIVLQSDGCNKNWSTPLESLAYKIVLASPNLTRIDGLWPSGSEAIDFWINPITTTNNNNNDNNDNIKKIDTLIQFKFNHDLEKEDVHKVAQAQPKNIEYMLTFPFNSIIHKEDLRSIIKSSKSSLQHLETDWIDLFYLIFNEYQPGSIITLENVHTLNLKYFPDVVDFQDTAPDINLQEIFPGLKTIQLECKHDEDWLEARDEPIFPVNPQSIGTVERLQFASTGYNSGSERGDWVVPEDCFRRWMIELRAVLPNVKHVLFKDSTSLDQMVPLLCGVWPSLESLHLLIPLYKKTGRFVEWDLHYFDVILGRVAMYQRGLKRLQIDFVSRNRHNYGVQSCPISIESVEFLLRMNRQLKIVIGMNMLHKGSIDLRNILAPLKPYVTFEHSQSRWGQ